MYGPVCVCIFGEWKHNETFKKYLKNELLWATEYSFKRQFSFLIAGFQRSYLFVSTTVWFTGKLSRYTLVYSWVHLTHNNIHCAKAKLETQKGQDYEILPQETHLPQIHNVKITPSRQSTPLLLCVIMCLRRLLGLLKLAVHWLQVYGFSPEWVLRWIFRLPFCVKRFPHCMQAYGFSPVWMRMWMVRVVLLTNDLPQKEQGMGDSPVWVARCVIRSSRLRKCSPQKLQSRVLLRTWGKTFCCWENWLTWLGCPTSAPTTDVFIEAIWVVWLFIASPPLLSCIPLICALSLAAVVKFRRLSWEILWSGDRELKAWSSEAVKRVLLVSCRGPSPRPWTLTILSSSWLPVMQEDSVSTSPCVLWFPKSSWPKKTNHINQTK